MDTLKDFEDFMKTPLFSDAGENTPKQPTSACVEMAVFQARANKVSAGLDAVFLLKYRVEEIPPFTDNLSILSKCLRTLGADAVRRLGKEQQGRDEISPALLNNEDRAAIVEKMGKMLPELKGQAEELLREFCDLAAQANETLTEYGGQCGIPGIPGIAIPDFTMKNSSPYNVDWADIVENGFEFAEKLDSAARELIEALEELTADPDDDE